jgi:hypothetical protein
MERDGILISDDEREKMARVRISSLVTGAKVKPLAMGLFSASLLGVFISAWLIISAVVTITTGIVLLSGSQIIDIIAISVGGIITVFAIVFGSNLHAKIMGIISIKSKKNEGPKDPS